MSAAPEISWLRHHRIDLALHRISEGERPSFRPLLLLHGLGECTPDRLPAGVEWDEAVLLAGDADAADVGGGGTEAGDDLGDHAVERRGPVGGVLLQVPDGQPLDERVGRAGVGDDAAGLQVEDDGLGALGA